MDSQERDKTVEQEKPDVPYVAYERAEAAYERHIKRYWILSLVMLVLLVGSNIAWLCFMYGFDFETHEVTADSNSNAYYNEIAGNVEGGVNNGGEDKDKKDDATERLSGEDDQNESEGAQQ